MLLCVFLIILPESIVLGQRGLPFGQPKTSTHPDRLVIESLVQAGLYELAIQSVESRIGNTKSSASGVTNEQAQWRMLRAEVQVAKLTAELSGFYDRPSQLEPKLAEIDSAMLQFQDDPRSVWFQYKAIWCRWYLLRSCVAGYLAAPTRTELQNWILAQIRDSIQRNEQLIEAIKQIPTKDLPQLKPDAIDAFQVSSIQAESYLLKCDLLALRATLYPAGSDERIAAATQMIVTMEEAEKRSSRDWPGRSQLQLARCRAQLFLGLAKESLKGIASVFSNPEEGKKSIVSAAIIAAEAHRMLGETNKSNEWIDRAGGWQSHPGLALEYFSNQLVGGGDTTQVAKALGVKKEIGERFGGYWESRADALLVSSNRKIESSANPTANLSLELLKSEVKQLMAAKKWQEAIEKLSQAEIASAHQNQNREALRLAMQSAAIWGLQKSFDSAASEFHRAAMTYQDEPKAPDCAVNALNMLQEHIKTLQERLSNDASQQEAINQTLALRSQVLRDIIMIWPASEQADVAVQVLESLLISEDRPWNAVDVWLERCEKLEQKSASAKKSESLVRAMEWYSLLVVLQSAGWLEKDLLGENVDQKLDEREKRLINLSKLDSQRLDELSKVVSLRQTFGWQDSVVVSLPQGSANQSNQWLRAWVECAGHYQQALRNRSQATNEWDAFQKALDRLIESTRESEVGNLGSQWKRSLDRHVQLYGLAIMMLKGQVDDAKQAIVVNEQASPRDPWWPYQGARLMQTQSSLLPLSIERYRRLASGLQAGQEAWLDCRARTVEALIADGKRDDAQKLIDVVLATYPNLSQQWKQRIRSNIEK